MKLLAHICLSLVLTVVLVPLWVEVTEVTGWMPSNWWVHGGIVVAIPGCFVVANAIAFLAIRLASKRWATANRRSQRHW
jgi:hypothetical protein